MSLGSRPAPSRPVTSIPREWWPQPLPERLRRQDVLDLAGADAKGQRPEGAVGAGVAVAADDRRARQRHAQLGTDHVHDPLMSALDIVQRDAKLAAVGPHRLDLLARQWVANIELVVGRHVVIDRGECQVRPPHAAARQPEPVKRLRTRHFVNQVPVDVQERRLVGRRHDMAIPDLLKQCLGHFQFRRFRRYKGRGRRVGSHVGNVSLLPIRHATRNRFARTTAIRFSQDNRLGARPVGRATPDSIELCLTIVIGWRGPGIRSTSHQTRTPLWTSRRSSTASCSRRRERRGYGGAEGSLSGMLLTDRSGDLRRPLLLGSRARLGPRHDGPRRVPGVPLDVARPHARDLRRLRRGPRSASPWRRIAARSTSCSPRGSATRRSCWASWPPVIAFFAADFAVGLPIMLLMNPLGAIDLRLILLAYAGLFTTGFFMIALAIWVSSSAADSRGAAGMSVLLMVAWLIGPFVRVHGLHTGRTPAAGLSLDRERMGLDQQPHRPDVQDRRRRHAFERARGCGRLDERSASRRRRPAGHLGDRSTCARPIGSTSVATARAWPRGSLARAGAGAPNRRSATIRSCGGK